MHCTLRLPTVREYAVSEDFVDGTYHSRILRPVHVPEFFVECAHEMFVVARIPQLCAMLLIAPFVFVECRWSSLNDEIAHVGLLLNEERGAHVVIVVRGVDTRVTVVVIRCVEFKITGIRPITCKFKLAVRHALTLGRPDMDIVKDALPIVVIVVRRIVRESGLRHASMLCIFGFKFKSCGQRRVLRASTREQFVVIIVVVDQRRSFISASFHIARRSTKRRSVPARKYLCVAPRDIFHLIREPARDLTSLQYATHAAMLGRRDDWIAKKRPELITRTVFRCARMPPHVALTDEYIVARGKEVAEAMKMRDADENGVVDFLPAYWEWTRQSFTAKVRACVKPINLHFAKCIDFAELERVYFGEPSTSANAPDDRTAAVGARADTAHDASTDAIQRPRDVAPIRATHMHTRPVATPSPEHRKRART